VASVNVISRGEWGQAPPAIRQLEAAFAKLNDEALLNALTGTIRRGPKGHNVKVLWHCMVAKHILGLSSTDALIRELHNNPLIAKVCGIESPLAIPHKSTFSRFIARLSKGNIAPKVKDVSRSLVRDCYTNLPGFGDRVAIDSSTLKGWSNGGKTTKSDREAAWSVKKNTHGKDEYVFGWKLHLMVDCEYELPVSAHISPGNVHDSQRASNLLSEARWTYGKFMPSYVMADKGYSSKELHHKISVHYHSTPVIDINPAHKTMKAKMATLHATPGFKALRKQRTAVERAFSRLKGQRSLNRITTRGLRKVTVHCYLALIALHVIALAS
jgi:IS5 family transposase